MHSKTERQKGEAVRPQKGPKQQVARIRGASVVSVFPSRRAGKKAGRTHSEKQEVKPQGEENKRAPKPLHRVMTGTPKATCRKTMRMTAVWETRKRQTQVPRTRELLEKRRESDEQRVGEGFGKVMRVELVGCKQEEHNLKKEGAG